jgi:TRAP-type C4-dicarboxylate transport system substrate-binding protein
MTITHYSTGPDPFIVSLDWYESLDADLQELFDVVAREAIRYSDELNRQSETTYVERLREELIVNVLNSEQQQAFRSLVAPVYEHFIDSGVLSDSDIKRARDIAEAGE